MRVLAERFADRPETFELLRARAGADDSESVRATAVRGLAKGFADRPETFELLRARAGADDSESVRATAVIWLVERFADRPETFELLRARAGADDSEYVRRSATIGLTRELKLPRLRTLLSQDLDGLDPGLDPHVVIASARVTMSAKRLGVTPDIIREDYERLVREHHIPLRLSWLEGNA